MFYNLQSSLQYTIERYVPHIQKHVANEDMTWKEIWKKNAKNINAKFYLFPFSGKRKYHQHLTRIKMEKKWLEKHFWIIQTLPLFS